jgi:hypothetical protein
MDKKLDKKEKVMTLEIASLLKGLKSQIDDDFRASDDPEDSTPGMQVTVSTNDMESWNYQTGDNSYSGSCYGDSQWAVIYLYRRSNCKSLAQDAVNELADNVAECEMSISPINQG